MDVEEIKVMVIFWVVGTTFIYILCGQIVGWYRNLNLCQHFNIVHSLRVLWISKDGF